jgi:hypothetical protein
MNDLELREGSVLRWGGLAGVAGGILFILTSVIVIAFALPDPSSPRALERFPDIRGARALEDGLYLVAVILWGALFLALYRALRQTSLAPALFGSILGIAGLVVLAAGALPHVASVPISDLYHAPGATPSDQAALVLVWQATQGIFEALVAAGILMATGSLIALGAAMFGAPAFGKGLGRTSIGLGVVGVAAAFFDLVAPPSPIAAGGFLALTVFQLVLGWKVYSLSRSRRKWGHALLPVPAPNAGARGDEEWTRTEGQP